MTGAQKYQNPPEISESVEPEQWPSISQTETVSSLTAVNPSREPIHNESKIDDTDHPLMVIPCPGRGKLFRQRSVSTPNLRKLAVAEEDEIGNGPITPGLSPEEMDQVVTPTGPSFLEKLLSKCIDEEKEDIDEESPKPRIKTKPTFVVTPISRTIGRCSMSSPNLCALANLEGDTGEVVGESDAMEYYHRKSLGYNGRKNGMKLRPDEAKRLTMILHKKDMQRKAQANKGK